MTVGLAIFLISAGSHHIVKRSFGYRQSHFKSPTTENVPVSFSRSASEYDSPAQKDLHRLSSTSPPGSGLNEPHPGRQEKNISHRDLSGIELNGSHSGSPHHEAQQFRSINVSMYFENYGALNGRYGNTFANYITKKWKCSIPRGNCIFEENNKKADVLFKCINLYTPSYPTRYCKRQILAVMNSEADSRCTSDGGCASGAKEMIRSADIRADRHLTSEVVLTEACSIPWKKELYETPDPSKRKGVALLLSHCPRDIEWRNKYIRELMKYIHINSYGGCFHNVARPPSRSGNRWTETYADITKKHRMVVTFENTIEKDYITEKIGLAYKSGVIPVYWGPSEIYKWAPGNHSFIDPQKFKGPKELAEYLKRVDEDDNLFRYHTTNFDFERTRKMADKYCDDAHYVCKICKKAQDIKLSRIREGLDPPTC